MPRAVCAAQARGSVDRYTSALQEHAHSLKELNDPSKYYITHELASELRGLEHGFDMLRYNEQTFQGCRNWRELFRERDLHSHRDQVMAPLNTDRAHDLAGRLKSELALERTRGMQGVDLAALHHRAKANLAGYRRQLEPSVALANLQLSQFGEWLGASSQYDRHRQKLENGGPSLPVKPHCPERQVGRWNLPLSFTYAKEIGLEVPEVERPSQLWRKERRKIDYSVWRSPIELAGVITRPHVTTETKDRYRRPVRPNEPIECINPNPDFGILGKFAPEPKPEPRQSEYQTRYLSPDGSLICTKPWARDKEVISPRENKSKYGWARTS